MLKDYFIKKGIKEAEIEKNIRDSFPYGDYSRTELQRTPLGIKIVIYTNKPGRIIGRGGKNINDITEAIKGRFNLENPQIDVKSISNPNLDAKIVAKQIASAIERGYNYKKIGNLTLQRVMESGAIGAEIVIGGKVGGNKGMQAKFLAGYIKHCGNPAKELVEVGFEEANTKPGKVGIKVKIMKEFEDITGVRRRAREKVRKEPELVEVLAKTDDKPEEEAILEQIIEEKAAVAAAPEPVKSGRPRKDRAKKEDTEKA
ncbi:MAG: 30S ribosomal protein S3 [Candidatus Aenigmarchaeota archaeon]|nr:30S ribosomal protein S3 [Candidatus Aenigmarchaeota archaeon]